LFRAADPATPQRFAPLAAPLDRIHRELKREFDPAGIFNRGRLFPDF
jgi:glycolate oxidase FAD binding subunit